MKTELTPQEVAENLDRMAENAEWMAYGSVKSKILRSAASIVRKVANGEYSPVVHGHKIFVNNGKVETWCSNCNNIIPKYADFGRYFPRDMDYYIQQAQKQEGKHETNP